MLKSFLQRLFRRRSVLKVPPGCRAKEGMPSDPYTQTPWASVILHNRTGMELVFVPAGEFMMGASQGDASEECGPRHLVRIERPFYLGRYEVKVAEFRAYCLNTGHLTDAENTGRALVYQDERWQSVSQLSWKSPGFLQSEDHPTVCLSWNDALSFCEWAGLRLPSEAEWEYACRAGTDYSYPFGEDPAALRDHSWYKHNSGGHTHSVGELKPNAWGFHDMLGNAWEWCEDIGHFSYEGAPADGRAWLEDGEKGLRILRGGSWCGESTACRVYARTMVMPENSSASGFRCVLDIQDLLEESMPAVPLGPAGEGIF